MMATGPSPKIAFGMREDEENYALISSENQMKKLPASSTSIASTSTPQKKRRNLPGVPNPDAEIVALSPKTLMATNRFICEVCNKGFQREQNLQLHRRGHNLPWKLKQKSTKEVRKKVYLCPEPTCVHHEPSRALGDLTGIKKHFCRKHGEKKWKCEKCSKKYAVQSDWKAHSKICGTREYRCDCGTLFSRRDSFITHRAFCDALAQESARLPSGLQLYQNRSSDLFRFEAGMPQLNHLLPPPNPSLRSLPSFFPSGINQNYPEDSETLNGYPGLPQILSNNSNNNPVANLFNLGLFSNGTINNKVEVDDHTQLNPYSSDQFNGANVFHEHIGDTISSLYTSNLHNESNTIVPQLSAIALLHKAAQMGSTAVDNASLLGGFDNCNADIELSWQDQRSSSSSSSFLVGINTGYNNMTNLQDPITTADLNRKAHLQDHIMNSIDQSHSSAIFAGSRVGDHHANGTARVPFGASDLRCQTRETPDISDLGDFARNGMNSSTQKIQHAAAVALNLGGSDSLTRDFLGVGGMNTGFVGGGFGSQREPHHERSFNFASMDLATKYNEAGFLQ